MGSTPTGPKIKELGLNLISVSLKDIMFPGKLKEIFAQVVSARKEGLAALEKAKAETAALRNLANAAKMTEGNPNLMQLRLVQALGESSGNTLVLGMPSQGIPFPVSKHTPSREPKGKPSEEPQEEDWDFKVSGTVYGLLRECFEIVNTSFVMKNEEARMKNQ